MFSLLYSNFVSGSQLLVIADIFSSLFALFLLTGSKCCTFSMSDIKWVFMATYAAPFFQSKPSNSSSVFSILSLTIFPVFSDVMDG